MSCDLFYSNANAYVFCVCIKLCLKMIISCTMMMMMLLMVSQFNSPEIGWMKFFGLANKCKWSSNLGCVGRSSHNIRDLCEIKRFATWATNAPTVKEKIRAAEWEKWGKNCAERKIELNEFRKQITKTKIPYIIDHPHASRGVA